MVEVKQVQGCSPKDIPNNLLTSAEPIILKGLVDEWPIVKAAKDSAAHACEYLNQFYQGMTIGAGIADAQNDGRLFYKEDFSGFNFSKQPAQLDDFLAQILASIDDDAPISRYVGSTSVDKLLPNFRQHNDLPALSQYNPLASIWLGNRSRIAAHHDVPSNIACCVAGKRRFTLFPPEQVENLYLGPLDYTPAGQAISLVDFHQPDFDKHPKFKTALKHALIAELDPGDALFVPSLWWHHVEGLSSFNLLINYWWQTTPAYMGAPMDAMFHALLNIKHLPSEQKSAWLAMFKYYVFNEDSNALAHIPEEHLGVLNSSDERAIRQIRAMLINKLNR